MQRNNQETPVFVFETCQNCKSHHWNTRHDENKYIEYFNKVSAAIVRRIPQATTMRNMIPTSYLPFDLYCNLVPNNDPDCVEFMQVPRTGSFEVSFKGLLVFSKLQGGYWPNVELVASKCEAIVEAESCGDDVTLFLAQGSARKQRSLSPNKGHNTSISKKSMKSPSVMRDSQLSCMIDTQQSVQLEKPLTPVRPFKMDESEKFLEKVESEKLLGKVIQPEEAEEKPEPVKEQPVAEIVEKKEEPPVVEQAQAQVNEPESAAKEEEPKQESPVAVTEIEESPVVAVKEEVSELKADTPAAQQEQEAPNKKITVKKSPPPVKEIPAYKKAVIARSGTYKTGPDNFVLIDYDDDCVTCAKSGSGSGITYTFVNDTDEQLVCKWVDYGGELVEYYRPESGGSYEQTTYITHPWAICKEDDTVICTIKIINEEAADMNIDITMTNEDGEIIINGMNREQIAELKQEALASNDPISHDNPDEEFQSQIAFVNEVLAAGEPWTDPEFPPCQDSLCKPGEQDYGYADTWKRLSEVYPTANVFKGGIDPCDIQQGTVGDCYFLSTVAALAEVPERVEARIVSKEVNGCGIYAVNMFVNGKETCVIVDDFISVTDWGASNFSKSKTGEIWVILLEKAWAKLHGSYGRINGGNSWRAQYHLTGSPGYFLHHSEHTPDEVFERIQKCDGRGYIMSACSNSGSNADSVNGVVLGHAYTVLSTHEVDGEKLYKMRNPWGKGEWTGDWSDESDKWTDELREQLGVIVADDGIFYINHTDYVANYCITDLSVELFDPLPIQEHLMEKDPITYWDLTFPEDYDTSEKVLVFTANQRGLRVQKHRVENPDEKFKSTNHLMCLFKEDGEIIMQRQQNDIGEFATCTFIIRDTVIPAGTHKFMCTQVWNEYSWSDPDSGYQDLVLKCFCREDLNMTRIDIAAGEEIYKISEDKNRAYTKWIWTESGAEEFMTKDQWIEVNGKRNCKPDAEEAWNLMDSKKEGQILYCQFHGLWFLNNVK